MKAIIKAMMLKFENIKSEKNSFTVKDLLECISILAIIGLLIFAAKNAKADDILVGQITHHFHDYINWKECRTGKYVCDEYNENQELIGYATDKYALVYMRQNSVYNESFVFTRVFKYDLTSNLRPYAAAGIATGYYQRIPEQSIGKITPMGYFGVDIHPKSDKFGLMITWTPDSFIGAGLRFKIN